MAAPPTGAIYVGGGPPGAPSLRAVGSIAGSVGLSHCEALVKRLTKNLIGTVSGLEIPSHARGFTIRYIACSRLLSILLVLEEGVVLGVVRRLPCCSNDMSSNRRLIEERQWKTF